ncbi:MAG: glycosyltransferase, partial [Nakamurella sp.]
MLTAPVTRKDGRWIVPGNRWDLVGPETPEPVDVSVVIPYYEGQHGLDLILAGLARQTHPRSRLQVVIADDGSAVPPHLRDVGVDLVMVRQEDLGFRAAAARNLGAAHADGQVLVLLDGDTV